MYILKVKISDLHLKHNPFEQVADLSFGYAGGVNWGYFFRPTSHPRGSESEGAVIVDGKIQNSRVVSGRPALIHAPQSSSGKLRIQNVWGVNAEWAFMYRILAQAGPQLVDNGRIIESFSGYPGIDPYSIRRRVGVGILDQETVMIIAGESSLPELGSVFVMNGCNDALAGDGGSSVSLVVNGDLKFGGRQLVPNALVWERAEYISGFNEKEDQKCSRCLELEEKIERIRAIIGG